MGEIGLPFFPKGIRRCSLDLRLADTCADIRISVSPPTPMALPARLSTIPARVDRREAHATARATRAHGPLESSAPGPGLTSTSPPGRPAAPAPPHPMPLEGRITLNSSSFCSCTVLCTDCTSVRCTSTLEVGQYFG